MTTLTQTVPQRHRANLGVAIAVVLCVLLLTVAVTESRIGANAGPRAEVGVEQIARSLRGSGLEVAETGEDVTHRLLGVTGRRLQVNGVSVDVYTYATVAQRVADEQRWNEQVMGLATLRDQNIASPPRITSVGNILLLIHTNDATLLLTITHALNDLTH